MEIILTGRECYTVAMAVFAFPEAKETSFDVASELFHFAEDKPETLLTLTVAAPALFGAALDAWADAAQVRASEAEYEESVAPRLAEAARARRLARLFVA